MREVSKEVTYELTSDDLIELFGEKQITRSFENTYLGSKRVLYQDKTVGIELEENEILWEEIEEKLIQFVAKNLRDRNDVCEEEIGCTVVLQGGQSDMFRSCTPQRVYVIVSYV